MNIAVIGTGNIGGNIGKIWADKGHKIIYGTREPESERIKKLIGQTGNNSAATDLYTAPLSADIILLALPWKITRDFLKSAKGLENKIIIDATNPLKPGMSGMEISGNISAAEEYSIIVPGSKIVKAFNTVGSELLFNPVIENSRLSLLFCGNDPEAKQTVKKLGEDIGFEMVDAGPLKNALQLEHLALLWIELAYKQGYGDRIGFKLLKG